MDPYRFPRALAWSNTQTATSKIWTWVDNFITYENNRFTKSASSYGLIKQYHPVQTE